MKKNHPETRNQPKTKNLTKLIYVFRQFQGKKTPNVNSFHQMKQFNTNIECFYGQIRCNGNFLSLVLNFSVFLSFISNQEQKNKKKKVWNQN
jgi:hypothetical protein